MAILSISIPSSARRTSFNASVPQSAAAATAVAMAPSTIATAAPSVPGTAGLNPGVPNRLSLHAVDANLLARTLGNLQLSSLDDLLGAIRTRNPNERDAASTRFREQLVRDRDAKLAAEATSAAAAAASAATSNPIQDGAAAPPAAAAIHTTVNTNISDTYLPDTLQSKLLAFAAADELEAKWAVILAVREILRVHPCPDARAAARLALAVSRVIPCNDAGAMNEAARLFAQLVPLEGMLSLANTQVAQALEWLEDSRSERKRLGAVFLLTELMANPNSQRIVAEHAGRAIDAIWHHALLDQKREIREAGKLALGACVEALTPAESYACRQSLLRLAAVPLESFTSSHAAAHGAILTCTILVVTAQEEENIVQSTCKLVTGARDRDAHTSAAYMQYLVAAAEHDREGFNSTLLPSAMLWLVSALRREKDQVSAFATLAKVLPVAPPAEIDQYQESLMAAFHGSLTSPKRSDSLFHALLQFVGGCAQAYGPAVENAIMLELDNLFLDGLSQPLVDALGHVVRCVPGLAFMTRMTLLDQVALALSGKTFQEFANPVPSARRASVAILPETPRQTRLHRRRSSSLMGGKTRNRSISPKRGHQPIQSIAEDDVPTQVLALKTLASFDFAQHPLLVAYFRQHVIGFCSATASPELRRAALEACASFLLKSRLLQPSGSKSLYIREMVQAILYAATTDSDCEIRQCAVGLLSADFDFYLTDLPCVHMMLFALNDAHLPVRLGIIDLLGRTMSHVQFTVLPALRNELAALLTLLDQSKTSATRAQTLTVIKHILAAGPALAEVYFSPISSVLLDVMKTSETEEVTLLVLAIARLLASHASPAAVKPHASTFLHAALEALKDQASSEKRRAAILTINDIVAQTVCMGELEPDRDTYLDLIIGHLARETTTRGRRDAVKVLGTIGAIRGATGPSGIEEVLSSERARRPEISSNGDTLESGLISADPDTSKKQYPLHIADWVLSQLMDIWNEPSLRSCHLQVADVISRIFRHEKSRMRSWHYTGPIITRLIEELRTPRGDNAATCFYISVLSTLSVIVEWRVEEHIPTILGILFKEWDAGLEPSTCIIECIAALSVAMRGDFVKYQPVVVPRLAASLLDPATPDATALAVLRFVQQSTVQMRDWSQCIVPALLHACDTHYSTATRTAALDALLAMAGAAYVGSFLSRVLTTLTAATRDEEVGMHAARTLCAVVKECGPEALPFAMMFEPQLGFTIVEHPSYEGHVPGTFASSNRLYDVQDNLEIDDTLDGNAIVTAFQAPWEDSGWHVWLDALCLKVAKMTNNHHIRASAVIAEQHVTLRRNLLNYAVWSAWFDLDAQQREDICINVHHILSVDPPAEVHDVILHLIDFLSRMGIELGISPKLCKEVAMQRRFLNRATRYAELEYDENNDEAIIAQLLEIESQFQVREIDHAVGLLQLTSATVTEFAELGDWHANLQGYDALLLENPKDTVAAKGVVRSLHALQEWDLLMQYADCEAISEVPSSRKAVAPLVASAAWSLGDMKKMAQAVELLQGPEKTWYSAVLAVMSADQHKALDFIQETRDILSEELVKIGRTRTGRGYDILTRAQLLTELEEVTTYQYDERSRPLIRERWTARLENLQKEPEVLGRCLKVHWLAVSPVEDIKNTVKYARICRKAGKRDLAIKIQALAMNSDNGDPLNLTVVAENEYPGLTLERCRLAHDYGWHEKAREGLKDLTLRLSERIEALGNIAKPSKRVLDKMVEETNHLGKALHSLGDYTQSTDLAQRSLKEAQQCYQRSTELSPHLKGYRKLTSVTLSIIEYLEAHHEPGINDVVSGMAIQVIEAYIESILRAPTYPLQDILGFLTVAFRYGHIEQVADIVEQDFATLPIDCWLEAIPQLTSQLNHPSPKLQPIVERHMQRLARAHPHTMLASLTAITQYPSQERAVVANRLLEVMRLYDDTLVSEAIMLNQELIRSAMNWEEICIYAVETAAKFLFGEAERNVPGLVAAMEDMCKRFDNPQTVAEHEFIARWGETMKTAREIGRRCLVNGSERDISIVWKHWHTMHKHCTESIKHGPSTIDLGVLSPRLSCAKNMALSVPGTHIRHSGEIVRIVEINRQMDVLASKQRPRKLTMLGSDGKTYRFLLKPREDLRMDERCMQFFNLVNSLLIDDQHAAKRHLRIVRFSVVPLSHTAGLLSWFERGDTLQAVVKHYRKVSGVPADAELRWQHREQPSLKQGTLSIMQHIELFESSLEQTKGDDIARVMWRKSSSAAAWAQRRTAFSRSMATNSMVGHILGLGDRHPSNILLDRVTAEVVHVDFGDCFETAQERDSFPERFPFRLTRQLVNAMGPTGVEGHFRLCSEHVMRIMRDHKESIEAVFSAFVHDPLIQHLVLQPRQLDVRDGAGAPAAAVVPTAAMGTEGHQNNHHHHHHHAAAAIITRKHHFSTMTTSSSSTSKRKKGDGATGAGVLARERDKDTTTTTTKASSTTRLSSRGQRVVDRVKEKLRGREFGTLQPVNIDEQVARLIVQATDSYALATAYSGWCPFW